MSEICKKYQFQIQFPQLLLELKKIIVQFSFLKFHAYPGAYYNARQVVMQW